MTARSNQPFVCQFSPFQEICASLLKPFQTALGYSCEIILEEVDSLCNVIFLRPENSYSPFPPYLLSPYQYDGASQTVQYLELWKKSKTKSKTIMLQCILQSSLQPPQIPLYIRFLDLLLLFYLTHF